jgi:cyclic nucleotide-binding protein
MVIMETNEAGPAQANAELEAFIRGLIEKGAQVRLPELFAGKPAGALYYVPNRNGVSVVALRTNNLSQEQLAKIMTYRLAQYIAVNIIDRQMIYKLHIDHEPLSDVSSDEIHVVAGSAESGEILCYLVIYGRAEAPAGMTLRLADHPYFPLEKLFGCGIYNCLKILPDLPVAKVRELGRFVKNQQKAPLDDLAFRAVIEVGCALFQILIGPLREEVDACIGCIEEEVAKKNMDFFHVPLVVIHGVVPYFSEGLIYWRTHFESCNEYPFAFLVSDLSHAMHRLKAIEQALNLPVKQGIMALLGLKHDLEGSRSSLEPPGGLPPLADAAVPQKGVPMQTRGQWLELGGWLRTSSLFSSLSVAEAAVLGTFMERCSAEAGDVVLRQGETGDDLYLIEAGQAEVRTGRRNEEPRILTKLGPGDYFGEIALVTGGERTADVVAITTMTLLRLTKNAYSRFLAHQVEVESQLTRTALTRAYKSFNTMSPGDA